jgi:hypothetical protein
VLCVSCPLLTGSLDVLCHLVEAPHPGCVILAELGSFYDVRAARASRDVDCRGVRLAGWCCLSCMFA